MPVKVKVSGAWKDAVPKAKVSGAWKDVSQKWVKVSGVWESLLSTATGNNVYTGSQDGTVRKLNSNGNEIWSFTGHTGSSVFDVAVDSLGNVYTGSTDNTVRKIDSNGNQIWSFTGHTASVYAVAVDP